VGDLFASPAEGLFLPCARSSEAHAHNLVRAREFPLREPARPTVAFALNLLKLGEGCVVPGTSGVDIRRGLTSQSLRSGRCKP
jgi:hypothetical protein